MGNFFKEQLNKLKQPVSKPRWGHGRPAHPMLLRRLARSEQACLELIGGIDYAPRLRDIPLEPPQHDDRGLPWWRNDQVAPLDGLALTEIIRKYKPRNYVEVGSGMSTRFARNAVGKFGLTTKIFSIDADPKPGVDSLCDGLVKKPLEDCIPIDIPRMGANDLFFVDTSHQVFQNSDAIVFFLEVLPALAPGVIVGINGIFLPVDYPPDWSDCSEQYLLAAWLLANPLMPEVIWPVLHSCAMDSTRKELNRLMERVFPPGTPAHAMYSKPDGKSFWFKTN